MMNSMYAMMKPELQAKRMSHKQKHAKMTPAQRMKHMKQMEAEKMAKLHKKLSPAELAKHKKQMAHESSAKDMSMDQGRSEKMPEASEY
jgi:hypothetical protein